MTAEHILSDSDVGNWSVTIGGKRVPFAPISGVGLVLREHIGRRVWRQAGAYFLETDQQRRMREVQANILSFGL